VPSLLLEAPATRPFARHLTRAGGVHIHWAEAGLGRATVMLHGFCDSHRTWRKVMPALSRSRRLLLPDLPGHGLSDRPDAPYTVAWYAAIIGAWVDAIGLRSFDLVGHSFGGGVAQMLLLTHGARIGRLGLVASGGLGREVSFGLRLWSMAEVADRFAQPLIAPSTRLALGALLPGADPQDIDFLSWMNAMPGTARALSRTVREAIDWRGQRMQLFDRLHELPEALPIMELFWGDQDHIVPFDHATEVLTRLEHVRLTRFKGSGHFPHQEQPEAFVAALESFLGASNLEPALLRGAMVRVPRPSHWRLWLRRVVAWLKRQLARVKRHHELPSASNADSDVPRP
jgi:pimeloyl-ACP methyl ester carboxylesterase